jgi:hypothetical protein
MLGRNRRRFPPRSLRRAFAPRAQRAAYWAVGVDRLTVAIIEPGDVEPVLTASATVRCKAQTSICPGILETALLVDAARLPHFVALEPPCCRLVRPGHEGAGRPAIESQAAMGGERQGLLVLEVPGNLRVLAWTSAVGGLYRVFRSARMNLRRVHCGEIARLCLAAHLDDPEPLTGDPNAGAARLDPLAAVSLADGYDLERGAGASQLCVPVGLALLVINPGLEARAGLYELQGCDAVGERAPDGA